MIGRAALTVLAFLLGTTSAFAHSDGILIHSTAAGGGALVVTGVADEAIPAPLVFCSNGECLYVSEEEAILTPEEDDLAEGLYALASATNLRLEIVSIDPGASLKVAGAKLDHAGKSVSIGKAPIHTHLFWQIEAPEGEIGEWRVVFRVKTSSPAYDPSPDIEVVVTNDELATTTSSSTSTSTTTLGETTCGNAVVEVGEACDAGAEPWSAGRACDGSCQWIACGDPDGDGESHATDALFALAVAVGVEACDACVCNVDSSATPAVSGGDALRILRYAVGLDSSPLLCPLCSD